MTRRAFRISPAALAAAIALHIAAAVLLYDLLASADHPSELKSKPVEVFIVPPQPLAMADTESAVVAAPAAPPPPEKKPAPPAPKPVRKPPPKAVKQSTVQKQVLETSTAPPESESEPVTPAQPAAQPAPPAPAPTPAGPPATTATPARTSVSVDATAAATNRKPLYPPMAQRYCEFGTVVLRVYVNAEGRAETVELKQSSGYPSLDQSAKTAVQSWRFRPGTVDGKPVAEWYQQPIPFQKPPHC